MNFQTLSLKKYADSIFDAAKSQFGGILLLIGGIWAVYLLDFVPFINLGDWLALYPRRITGLIGIATMPLVHGGLTHLVSNTIPLIVTLITLATLRPKQWVTIVGLITVLSGVLTWVAASSQTQIVGASGLILGLVTFLIAPGGFVLAWWVRNRFSKQERPYPFQVALLPIVVSAVVGFFCLDNLLFNLVPIFAPMGGNGISYTAHWCGAIAGVIVAFFWARNGESSHTASLKT